MKIFPLTLIRSGGLPLAAWLPLSSGMPDWDLVHDAIQIAAEQVLKAFDEVLFAVEDMALRTKIYNARKDFYQRRKVPSESLLEQLNQKEQNALRIALQNWQESLLKKKQAEIAFEQKLLDNYRVLQHLPKAWDGMMERALLFASHDLLANLPVFSAKEVQQMDKKDRRSAFSLLQYLSRAVFKTSPLGRFTTVQIAPLNRPSTQVEDGFEMGFDTKSLLAPNVAILPAIYEVLLREPAFYTSLRVSLNPCVTEATSDLKWLYFDGEQEAFQHINADAVTSLVVQRLLSQQRSIAFNQLLEILEQAVDATNDQLQALVFQWIDMGLLEWHLPELGLSTSWCGGLYNYLGYLPSAPILTEAAYLLQWMRTAARVLPFQGTEEAQDLQRETIREAKKFLEKYGGEMPPIAAEQIFFEDVGRELEIELPTGVVETLTSQLANCWKNSGAHVLSPFRARLFEYANQVLQKDQSIDFLEFSEGFLTSDKMQRPAAQVLPKPGKIGAMLQVFQENGAYKAVVNAMYPGGGKMFARWLGLFPSDITTQIKHWQDTSEGIELAFPWQGWSNANFQPLMHGNSLAVPDSRIRLTNESTPLLLGELSVRKDDQGRPQLFDKQRGKPVTFTDLGLEAPETRPPVMQILWYLGVPMVTVDSLIPREIGWQKVGALLFRERVEYESLILSRAAWELPEAVWAPLFTVHPDISQAERIGLAVAALKSMGIPTRFFGQVTSKREKPQFYDMDSPISMLLLEKNLREKSGSFRLTEMLPLPEQWLGDRVGELVVEFLI